MEPEFPVKLHGVRVCEFAHSEADEVRARLPVEGLNGGVEQLPPEPLPSEVLPNADGHYLALAQLHPPRVLRRLRNVCIAEWKAPRAILPLPEPLVSIGRYPLRG
eukprot:CAMPEP_0185254434 /NCGR_PEP_ID=MMETSP1359-20130426/3227_1 /TAXON_ID=552665 /ORGANISM="Bigelowiella longifila, Strain CCMP242" /LENGTH=104 /DNA_ID=CAMNT_0027837433 /DNA_START=93 /DNA_END=404 /DNA_ORIENTATION=-